MPNRATLCFLFLSLFSFFCAQAAEDWHVEIVPSRITPAKISEIDSDEFFVILTNLTNRDLTIWREWCSWGYSRVTFTVTRADGKTFELERYGGWTWNFPDATLVPPGQHCVYKFSFRDQQWGGFPKDFHTEAVTIQAHYAITGKDLLEDLNPSPAYLALKAKVWTGQSSSKPIKVTLAKPDTQQYH